MNKPRMYRIQISAYADESIEWREVFSQYRLWGLFTRDVAETKIEEMEKTRYAGCFAISENMNAA